jgi:hypothetical protein
MKAQRAVLVRFALPVVALGLAVSGWTGASAASPSVTFTKDVAPILQRSCQSCHRPDGGAPMSLTTYGEVRPWARAMKTRTGMGPRAGVMPPWYIEKDLGIQEYENDMSLTPQEIATIAKWVDSGALQGNPADMPPPRQFPSAESWSIGTPDLIVKTPEVLVKANQPDWWGPLDPVEMGLTEDRYVSAVEVREVNDVPKDKASSTVGGRWVVHHLGYTTVGPDEDPNEPRRGLGWPTHEVGRNADVFDSRAGRLVKANSRIEFEAPGIHLHANGRDTKAHLLFGFKFHPKGYKPTLTVSRRAIGNGLDIDIRANKPDQQLHAYMVLDQPTKLISFEPHLHAPGARMCLEAIWGFNIQTLTCSGYDHNWVRIYEYADDVAPLLPKGTILHIIGYMDTTAANKNVTDSRNWSGGGNRSISNMFLEQGWQINLTEEQFREEMAHRREKMQRAGRDFMIGCPLCNLAPAPGATSTTAGR